MGKTETARRTGIESAGGRVMTLALALLAFVLGQLVSCRVEAHTNVQRTVVYDPFASQTQFHLGETRFKGFSGPVGSGKTTIGLMLASLALRLRHSTHLAMPLPPARLPVRLDGSERARG